MPTPREVLTPGVVVVVTRHLGPYKLALRGGVSLAGAIYRSAALDRRVR